MNARSFITVMLFTILPGLALAVMNVPSQGWDGSLTSASEPINLAAAKTGAWDSNQGQAGEGIYDPEQWAVVFHYTDVTIPAGETLRFKNHPSGAPVVWLVSGSVTIEGEVFLNGENGTNSSYQPTEPGPGGFAGGAKKHPRR